MIEQHSADVAAPVTLIEVSPRDGLQNESRILTTADKVDLICRAVASGIRRIEVASFVNPRRVPQMADAEAVVAALPKLPGVEKIGLVLNARGAERALAAGIDELGIVCVASDPFGLRNQGQTIEDSVTMACEQLAEARRRGRSAQVTIAVAFGCPFSGPVPVGRVVEIARRVAACFPREIALADTIGIARPAEVRALVGAVTRAVAPLPLRVHFHDTRGTGIANVVAAVEAGVTKVDASIAGIGGCPFAPGAAGNVATEDVVYALGDRVALDLDRLVAAARHLSALLGRAPASALARLGLEAADERRAG